MSPARRATPFARPRRRRTALASACFASIVLLSLGGRAVPLLPEAPTSALEFEAQFAQPDAASSQGLGAAFNAVYRFTDQLAVVGSVSTLVSRAGPFSTAGAGIRGLIDITPLAPFLDVQLVALGPQDATGYTLATRIGGGADWQLSPGFALGLAVRVLTPFNGNASVSQGVEVGFRFVLTPALLN